MAATPVVKLKKDDEFVFVLKYGNFTRTKLGYSIDGEIVIKDGISAPEARLYINRDIRDLIASDWPGRDGSFRAVALGDGMQATWKIIEVMPDPKNSNYDPEVRAWNNNTNSFEAVGWDDHPGLSDSGSSSNPAAAGADMKPVMFTAPATSHKPAGPPTGGNAATTWDNLVSTAQHSWDAAGEIMSVPDEGWTPEIADARYKLAYTLYADARKMGILPGEVQDAPEDAPDNSNKEEGEDDNLPF